MNEKSMTLSGCSVRSMMKNSTFRKEGMRRKRMKKETPGNYDDVVGGKSYKQENFQNRLT
jgi:hypothetical protein